MHILLSSKHQPRTKMARKQYSFSRFSEFVGSISDPQQRVTAKQSNGNDDFWNVDESWPDEVAETSALEYEKFERENSSKALCR